MQSAGGGRSVGLLPRSLGSFGSSSSMRKRRMKMDRTCFCGLKTVIKKSRTPENPERLFHTCPRYRVDDNEMKFLKLQMVGQKQSLKLKVIMKIGK
ncbi:hypothetical protein AHAS_Ahas14G0031200 [Arachis hypogaea]